MGFSFSLRFCKTSPSGSIEDGEYPGDSISTSSSGGGLITLKVYKDSTLEILRETGHGFDVSCCFLSGWQALPFSEAGRTDLLRRRTNKSSTVIEPNITKTFNSYRTGWTKPPTSLSLGWYPSYANRAPNLLLQIALSVDSSAATVHGADLKSCLHQ